jgi:hypothetical protein
VGTGGKLTGMIGLSLLSLWCQGKHSVELYLHFAICLHEVYRDSFVNSTGYTVLNRQDGEWGNVICCKISKTPGMKENLLGWHVYETKS